MDYLLTHALYSHLPFDSDIITTKQQYSPPTGRPFHYTAEGYNHGAWSRRSLKRKTRRRRHDSRRNGAPLRLLFKNFPVFVAFAAQFEIEILKKNSKWTFGCLYYWLFPLVSQVRIFFFVLIYRSQSSVLLWESGGRGY